MSANQQVLLGIGGVAAPVDPYAADVVLLMRMEGADGSTTFIDSGPLATTIVNNKPADYKISTTVAKSGTSSMRCLSTDFDQFYYTNTTNHRLTGDFTVESWIYMTQAPAPQAHTVNIYPTELRFNSDRTLALYDSGLKITGTTAASLNAWHHVALTRSGTAVRMWLDGVQEGSTYTSSVAYNTAGTGTLIGQMMGYNTTFGYLDLVRITKVDRYGTSSFTPPIDY